MCRLNIWDWRIEGAKHRRLGAAKARRGEGSKHRRPGAAKDAGLWTTLQRLGVAFWAGLRGERVSV